MSGRDDLDGDRLAKIAALLGSPIEGERGAALEAVRRSLEGSGLTIPDLIRIPATGGVWRSRARRLLEATGLTDFERGFLKGIARWHGKSLSPKQERLLDEIEAAHGE